MQKENEQSPGVTLEQYDDGLSVLDLLIVLAKRKRQILGVTGFAAVAAIAASLLMTPIYTAKTAILPPQQSQSSASALLGQLGALAGAAGGGLGVKNPNDLYLGMLKSRTVQDAMVARFELKESYRVELQDGARKTLEKRTKASAGKDGIITIEVDDESPKRAAEMANAYVDELYKLTRVLAVTEASQRRLFYERQLQQTRDRLSEAESGLKKALDTTGIVKVDEQGRAMLETVARLRAQIAAKEVQIGAMQSFAAPNNPDLKLAQQELSSMKAELAKQERGGGADEPPGVTQAGVDNIKRLREVKYYETMYELLAKQFELARLDEAKESSLIQVLDKAVEPERKSKPKRAVMVIVATLVGLVLSIIWAFAREIGDKLSQDPVNATRLAALRQHLRLRT